MTAIMLKRDAVTIMKAALAGTKMSKFMDIMEAAFVDETKMPSQMEDPSQYEDDEDDEMLEELEEHPDQPQASTSTLSAVLKCKIPPTEEHPLKKTGVCSLADAKPCYPSVSDKERYLHCGEDWKFISDRISSHTSKAAGYSCKFSDVCREEGKTAPSCE